MGFFRTFSKTKIAHFITTLNLWINHYPTGLVISAKKNLVIIIIEQNNWNRLKYRYIQWLRQRLQGSVEENSCYNFFRCRSRSEQEVWRPKNWRGSWTGRFARTALTQNNKQSYPILNKCSNRLIFICSKWVISVNDLFKLTDKSTKKKEVGAVFVVENSEQIQTLRYRYPKQSDKLRINSIYLWRQCRAT